MPENLSIFSKLLLDVIGFPRKGVGQQIPYYASAKELEMSEFISCSAGDGLIIGWLMI